MTTSDTRLAPAHPRLVARTERVADLDRLTDSLGADGAAWLDGETGFVTAGIAAIVEPALAVAMLRTIEHEVGNSSEAIGPRAVGALPFEGGGRMIVPARIVARDSDGQCGAPRSSRLIRSLRCASPCPPGPEPLHDRAGHQLRRLGGERCRRARVDRCGRGREDRARARSGDRGERGVRPARSGRRAPRHAARLRRVRRRRLRRRQPRAARAPHRRLRDRATHGRNRARRGRAHAVRQRMPREHQLVVETVRGALRRRAATSSVRTRRWRSPM